MVVVPSVVVAGCRASVKSCYLTGGWFGVDDRMNDRRSGELETILKVGIANLIVGSVTKMSVHHRVN